MKKILLITVLLLLLIGGYFFLLPQDASNDLSKAPTKSQSTGEITRDSDAVLMNPTRIRIPKLNVDAAIEHVGMDSKGNMDIPKDWNNAAWYELGHKVGANGSAVIAAHYDTPSGEPSVFNGLSSLNNGDEIIVSDDNGNSVTFTVTQSSEYPFNDFPLNEVFNSTGTPMLNLITCDGAWDEANNTYSKRLVVYSTIHNS